MHKEVLVFLAQAIIWKKIVELNISLDRTHKSYEHRFKKLFL